MEALVRDEIVDHMMKNQLFCDEQHGFVPGRSCMTQLITCLDKWTELLENGDPVDIIYLDFQKAFDSVPHQRLLLKLEAYGITGQLKQWLADFLIGRRQRVVIGQESSDWAPVKSGIPQGSVLGPILFVIFINDLPDALSSASKIFADDTKLYRSVKLPEDNELLQQDISATTSWSTIWQLPFNIPKSHSLHLGYSNRRHQYTLNGQLLEATREEKDLGVIIDDQLKFRNHAAAAVKRANRVLGCIKRTIKYKEKEMIVPLYTALVRPLLEYGNVIWSPRFVGDNKLVEGVQRRATKLIPSIKDLEYMARLEELKLPSLEHRRRRGDAIQAFNWEKARHGESNGI